MNLDGVKPARDHVLRPHGYLLRHSAIAVLALVTPVFGSLYWLAIPAGAWMQVATAQAVVTVAWCLGAVGFLRTGIWVDHSGITERGFFGRVRNYPAADVGTVMFLELYLGDGLDTHAHLFVTGSGGRLLVRMRGQFYSRADMDTVLEQLAVPVVRVTEPMTLRELNRAHPELLYWFERRLGERTP